MKKQPTTIQACKAASALLLLIGTAAVGLSAGNDDGNSSSPSAPVTAMSLKTDKRVSILADKSIFSMRPPRPPFNPSKRPQGNQDTQPADRTDRTSPLAEQNFVLRGIGVEDGVPTAFFEQTVKSDPVRARIGETLSHGTLCAMSLDGVEYQHGDKKIRIAIGQNLEGKVAAPVARSNGWTSSGSTPAGEKPSWWGHKADDGSQAAAAPAAPAPDAGGYGNGNRRNRDNQDQGNQRDSRFSRGGRSDQTDNRDSRYSRGQSDQTDNRDSRGQSDQADSRDSRDSSGNRDSRDSSGNRDAVSSDSRDSRDSSDRRNSDSDPRPAVIVPDDLPPVPIIIDGN